MATRGPAPREEKSTAGWHGRRCTEEEEHAEGRGAHAGHVQPHGPHFPCEGGCREGTRALRRVGRVGPGAAKGTPRKGVQRHGAASRGPVPQEDSASTDGAAQRRRITLKAEASTQTGARRSPEAPTSLVRAAAERARAPSEELVASVGCLPWAAAPLSLLVRPNSTTRCASLPQPHCLPTSPRQVGFYVGRASANVGGSGHPLVVLATALRKTSAGLAGGGLKYRVQRPNQASARAVARGCEAAECGRGWACGRLGLEQEGVSG